MLERREFVIGDESATGDREAASEGAVTRAALARRPLQRTGDLLETVPGLVATQHSGEGKANQLFLRGFDLDHGTDFATWVDGMPVNSPSHAHGQGYTDLNFLIPELVRRIDYRKGPYRADDGNFASAGSARIALVDELPVQLRLTAGSYGYRRALLAGTARSEDDGQRLLGAVAVSGYQGPWRVGEGLGRIDAALRWSRADGDGRSSVTALLSSARWIATDQIPARAVADGRLDRFGSLNPSDGGSSGRMSLSARHVGLLDDGDWTADAWVARSRLDLFSDFTYRLDDAVRGDQFEQTERRLATGGAISRAIEARPGGLPADLRFGLQWRHDHVSPLGLYASAGRQRLATVQEGRVDEDMVGLWIESGLRLAPWLRLTGGGRVDRERLAVASSVAANAGARSATLASPKLSLVAGPWAGTELFLNWGNGFHSNDARGVVAQVSPRDGTPLRPVPPLVRSRGAEVGVSGEPLPGLRSSLALWRLDLASELVFSGDAGDTEANRASRRDGIEWTNRWNAAGVVAVDLDLAASRARYREAGPEGDRIPGAVERVATLGVSTARGPFGGSFRLRHVGPRPLVEDGSVRAASSTLAALRLDWHASRELTVALDVFNLFDRRASDIEYFYVSRLAGEPAGVADRHFHPAEPRAARLTVALNF